jgi:hypothetical protein
MHAKRTKKAIQPTTRATGNHDFASTHATLAV